MKHLLYYLFFFFWFVASLLPLRLLYFFSDLLYYPLYYVVRYRRKVVRKNLEESFPEKPLVELRKIEREFYHYFCDYIVETIKLFSMSEKQMRQRMTFGGVDKINEIIKHKDCVLYLGHYCNWEWVSSIPLHLGMTDNFIAGQIYHQIENKAFDKLFLWMRSRFHAVNIEMLMALRHLVRYKQQNKRFIIGFISDQSPNWNFVKMWTEFLNHKSSFFIGAESIAKATDAAVVYLDVQRVKRGYYHADFVVMTEDPKSFPDYEITVDYARRLEETIRRAPQYWLWSHNRWKRTYEKYLKLKSESA
ncbi:lysophospholipid acyltransferase family protein [Oscillospiraceae bacterium N12]|jgi:KDO2-lipid IV(A) lauroyltransferase|uniref:Lysophospholipid acyltransferase family protein n=1 Tax=Jilunia laotingensis TaxID=2763675 RepID=A0A926F641_9BACT|nr:lysophospholipid acyltransferase family protein [Jilunia laotingensis]MBC8592585.1 lysophospholipid acyltransferase family protein [Jilunia laotingensis]